MGILFSDGCVCSTTNGRFIINVGMMDKDVIYRFKKFLKSKNKIGINRKIKRYTISVCSRHLFKILNNYGCIERKSNVLGSPKIDEKFYFHFILGVIDGDGSISLNRSINSWKVSIGTGSFKFFTWLKKVFKKTGIKFSFENKSVRNKKFYIITFTGLSAKVLLNLLHKNSQIISMNRKSRIFKRLNKTNFRKGPNLFPWEITILKKKISNEACSEKIKGDARNYGWVRSPDAIRNLRRYHHFN